MAHTEVKDFLNQLVATKGVLYARLHQFHWYVKGPHFYTLHEKFEELYNDVSADLDDVAERLLAIGGEPYSTLAEFNEHSIIEEKAADKNLSADDMVRALVDDYKKLGEFLSEGIELAEDKGDHVSADMSIAIKEKIDLNVWMLQAYLGNEAK
ncbi:Dps family protein [Virgibacillus kimchii]